MPGEADPIRDLGAEPLSPTKECCNTTPTYRNNLRPEGKSGLERERERGCWSGMFGTLKEFSPGRAAPFTRKVLGNVCTFKGFVKYIHFVLCTQV